MAPLPSSSAAAAAQRRLACPVHGLVDPMSSERCPSCGRRPYALDEEADRVLFTNLRKVARSQRMNVGRLLGFFVSTPTAVVLMTLATGRLTFSVLHVFLIAGGTAALAVPFERWLRRLTPPKLRAIDRELLEEGDAGASTHALGP